MPTQTIAGQEVDVNEEGFMTDPSQWNREIAAQLAEQINLGELTDVHWKVIDFLRSDFEEEGETATLRRVSKRSGVPTKDLYRLFPKKPAKKMAYCAGLPKPHGCI